MSNQDFYPAGIAAWTVAMPTPSLRYALNGPVATFITYTRITLGGIIIISHLDYCRIYKWFFISLSSSQLGPFTI